MVINIINLLNTSVQSYWFHTCWRIFLKPFGDISGFCGTTVEQADPSYRPQEKVANHIILLQIISVEEGGGNIKDELRRLEQEVYQWQLGVYDVQMEILQEEEKLIKTQIKHIQSEEQGEKCTYFPRQ